MAQIVKLRRSSVSGQKPTNSNLQLGELALNTTDGKVFMAVSGSGGPSVQELVATNTVNTGSIHITDNITASYFTGSFIGDGSQLTNIPYSGVTGLELNKIVSGSVSASISPNRGLEINTDTTITGSLTITGSTTQIGNNTLLGTTLLSGSITISGSLDPSTPSVRIYGDTQTDGVIRFDPVSKNIDNSISASYLFVSSSTNDLYFTQNGNGYGNTTRLRWIEGNLYSGLLNGGKITAITGSTTFNIDAGSGIIVNLNASLTDNPYPTIKYVNWNAFTGQTLTYRTTHVQTYLAIDENGQIVQSNSPFIATQYNTLITLGTVIHQNQSTVNASITYPNVAYGYKQRTYDFVRAFGPLKLSGLNIVTTGSLGLNVGSGTAFADGRNYQNDPNNPSYITDSGTAVSKIFRYYQVSGNTFVQDTNGGLGYTGIDPTKYVNNGVLTTVVGDYTIQRVFWYPNSATKGIAVYYGNAVYSTIREAIDNLSIEPFIETENTKQNAVYLGSIIIAGNGDFTQPNKYTIIPGGLFRSVGGSGGGGTVPTQRLFDLSDVDVTTQQDNDLLVYNSNTLKWESGKSLNGSYEITGSLNVIGGLTGSIDYSNLTNVPTLVSSSEQVIADFSFTTDTITNTDITLEATSGDIILNADGGVYIGSNGAGNGVVTDGLLNLIIGDGNVINTGTGYSITDNLGYITSSFNSFTSSYTTGSFTGSFKGDGSQLYNIPASGVTGLNLSQIADGSATASISNTDGFKVNTDSEITGSLYVSGPLNIGETPVYGDINNPEVVHIYNSGSYNGIVALGDSDTFYQTYIANTNSGNTASTDLIIGADNVTDNTHYVDLGINSSTYNAGYVGFENDSYLYAASDDLYIGTIGLSNGHSDVHIFTSNSWQNPQITISGSKQIGFNTQTIDPGRTYQFSGSAKFNNGARFEESIDVQYNVTAGNYVDTPMVYHGGDFELRTNGVINLNSIYGQAVNVTGSLNVAGTITAQEFHTTFVTSSVMYTSGSTKFGDTNDDTHQFTGSVKILGNETVKGNVILENNGQIQVHSATTNTLFGHFDGSTIYGPYYQMFGNNYSNVSQRGSSEFVFDTRNGGESGFNVASFDGSTWIRKFRVDNEGAKITGSLTVTNNVTASFFTGSFIGDANGLTNVPFYISGSNISGTTVGKTFTKLQFDDSTGLNVDETEPGTAFISIGSHFKDIFVSGSPILSATGSDAFEIIGLGGIHISSSTVDTNGNGYVKELTFDLTEISSSLDSRITALTGSTGGGGISDGGYATLNQTTMAATWSFNHNLGQRYPIIQVFDSFGKVIIPSEIIMVDTSTTTITFPSAQSGKAVASLGTGPGGMTQFFTSAATWSLQHDLGADYPIVTIYDVNKNIIMPDRVTSIDSNNIEVGFTTPVAGHLNVAKGGHIISGSINFSNISTAGSGIVSSSIQVYNYGYATTGSNAFNGSQLIKNAKIDATCLTVSSGTSTIFTVSGYDGATFDYVVKNGVNRRAGTIVAIWDGSNSRFTETTTPDLGDTSNVSFTVSSAGALNAVVSSGTWTVEAMYRALNCS
jgi:hypothetical protein